MKATVKEWYMYILGAIIVISAAALTFALIVKAIPVENHDLVVVAISQYYGLSALVVGYFYASSKSSADKTTAINDVMTKLTGGAAKPEA
jgi:hypothetical protein